MKVVGLVSGGKDSCYNLMKCVEQGHEIVALANLYPPPDQFEMDSYMYQTVGNDAIQVYAEAWQLPLYRQQIDGQPINKDKDYDSAVTGDEVEDLFVLLSRVREHHPDVQGVSAGAIHSSYQFVRVANVCERLGMTPLCPLWGREQGQLLKDMIHDGVHAIIIKIAAMGLHTDKHLGMSLEQIEPHMVRLKDEFGLNICGEGGEFESLVLDCPLFKKRLVIDRTQTVTHSPDTFAPVAYLKICELHLEEK